MRSTAAGAALLVACASAFSVTKVSTTVATASKEAAKLAASAALAAAVLQPVPASASSSAAQISLQSLPPSSVDIQIKDLPVVGGLISGTYAKVPDGSIKEPSVTIKSPKDKVKAVQKIATEGHLEFDVEGFVGTHLDVDVALDEAGVATVKVASPLIPKLPLPGKKASAWKVVSDAGNGQVAYYFNDKTGETTYSKPSNLYK